MEIMSQIRWGLSASAPAEPTASRRPTTRTPASKPAGPTRRGDPEQDNVGYPSYWPVICSCAGRITPPEICEAIRNAAITAGTLMNLRN